MAKAPRIMIVEDDHIQAGFIRTALEHAFRGSEIKHIKTEHGFRQQLNAIEEKPPDVIVIDVMLRWTDPGPDQPLAPEDVKEGGHYHAGIRCAKLLVENEKTNGIPVILYTVLDRIDIGQELETWPHSIRQLTKDNDFGPLIKTIQEVLKR